MPLFFLLCRKNRPGEEMPPTAVDSSAAAVASCTSIVVDRSLDLETQDVVSPTSVDLERFCGSSCAPASYDEPIVDLHLPDEVRQLTDSDGDGATAALWIETSKQPPPSSPSSIVWRSREFYDVGPESVDLRRRSEGAAGHRPRWLPRSPAIEVYPPAARPDPVELPDPTANRVVTRRVSGSRLPNGIIPGARSSSPPVDQSGWTRLQPVMLTRPRSESNFAAVVEAPVAQRSDAAERLRSFPGLSSREDESATGRRRRRRTFDLAPTAGTSSPYVVSADDVNRSKLGRVSKEDLYRMWKASERSLHAQLRVAMQQKAELLQRLQAAGLVTAERLTVT